MPCSRARPVSRCRVFSPGEIDRVGLHRSNLNGLRRALHALAPPAEACLVDGFRLGSSAPEHIAVVDGDERSAAIAAASIVAKVVRDRTMRRMDALYPRYGFSSHVGYITPRHSRLVREHGPCRHPPPLVPGALLPERRSRRPARRGRLARGRSGRARSDVRLRIIGCAATACSRRTSGSAATSSTSCSGAGARSSSAR